MNFDFLFFVNSILLGIAFSANNFVYSMKNANNFKTLETKQTNLYSGIFSLVQLGFTFFGCLLAFIFIKIFPGFESMVPGISVVLLLYLAGKLFYSAYKWIEPHTDETKPTPLTNKIVALQGVVCSLDSISVGFVFYYYGLARGLLGCIIMAIFTFILCKQGFFHGKHFGIYRTRRAYVYGGIIMVLVGIELFIKGIFM